MYSHQYYNHIAKDALTSARIVVPMMMDLVEPTSVVDVGCGTGAWLSIFAEADVKTLCGYDGSWVDHDMLLIHQDQFVVADLEQSISVSMRYDLVLSLEVAEHLQESSAATFVESLTNLGDIILFSAAVPAQGGENHLNEQWPTYWAKLFEQRGFIPIDCIRQQIWDNPDVQWWYAQNVLLYVRNESLDTYPRIQAARDYGCKLAFSLVHPRTLANIQHRLAEANEQRSELSLRVEQLAAWGEDMRKQGEDMRKQGEDMRKQLDDLRKVKPGAISLKTVLRALPSLAKHALLQRTSRR